ncbi:hypothetical protein [Devosia sp.]|uniref:hypothetical protein n=1 Tax=Devosia sp. TaxID=1871048 RepID=UPI003A8D8A2F
MRHLRAALIALPLTFGVAVAQEAALRDMSACRLNDAMVTLEFTFDAGACDEIGTALVPANASETAVFQIPVVTSNDICTQQIVPIDFAQAIAVPSGVTALDVQLFDEMDAETLRASGTVDIAPESVDCMPPAVTPTGG